MIRLALTAFLLLAPCVLPSQTLQAPPVDQAAQDPVFSAYRGKFLNAIIRRDIDAILTLTDSDIHLSFGGTSGHAAFREFLTVDPSLLSEEYQYEAPGMREANWASLETALRMGGRFDDDGTTFAAPYTWTFDVPDQIDPFETYFVTGSGVALRERPIRFGRKVTLLNYEVLQKIDDVPGTGYAQVEMLDGTIGYVHQDYLRAYLDYRALFLFDGNKWLMTVFIAGD